jgi:hypothetical protein
MTAATLLLLALLPGADLQGRVRASPSGDAVPYATVRLPELRRAVSAGEDGSFVLPGVPEGRWRVQASAIGYQATEAVVRVGGGAVVRLDFDLVAAPVALARVEARGQRRDASASRAHVLGGPPPAGMDARALMSVPALAEADVLRAVQTLPAVAAASDFSGALYVRGGSPDQTLVMLDGAPLFNPYHLGGLFGAIDPATVESVDVLPGALPARAGDRLSGVVDIRTREGGRDAVRGSGALSLISTRASIDGPLPSGRGSYVASVVHTGGGGGRRISIRPGNRAVRRGSRHAGHPAAGRAQLGAPARVPAAGRGRAAGIRPALVRPAGCLYAVPARW